MKFENETPWELALKLSKNGCDCIKFSTIESDYNEYGGTTDYILDIKFSGGELQIVESDVTEDGPDWAQAENYRYESHYLDGKSISKSEALEFMKAVEIHFERSKKIDNLVK